ncbi:hypothetical protein [Novosphingobium sp. FKTRR1]|uniref:hypothetical protein n=1 Tax=Novosphingobium sp. FKTRR1 TaxID=2879118 RepID=UPI001CF0784E|nr:hypothetical protein [Novosphingobium sp. FKTRR1]
MKAPLILWAVGSAFGKMREDAGEHDLKARVGKVRRMLAQIDADVATRGGMFMVDHEHLQAALFHITRCQQEMGGGPGFLRRWIGFPATVWSLFNIRREAERE